LVIGNFTNEGMALYRTDGSGLYSAASDTTGIDRWSLQSLTFSTFFFDYDLDGLLDILAVNGHVADDISVTQPHLKYAEPALVFRNKGRGLFDNMSAQLGPALQKPIVGRGAAYADFDNDGDLDLAITEANGPARLLRNENGNQNDMLRVKLLGTRSNRDGIGAKLTLQVDKNIRLLRMVKTASGYLSQSELPVTFGLGKPDPSRKMKLTIAWPSGHKDTVENITPNQTITVQEGKGIVAAHAVAFQKPKP
jgi:enediyne biosynthesis protein E4